MVGIRIRVFSNDQMVARLSTETNQKSAEIIGNKLFFRKLRPPTEFVFRPYLSNGGGYGTPIQSSPVCKLLIYRRCNQISNTGTDHPTLISIFQLAELHPA
jgi:hypothetical protein